jgi:dCTP deaminase
MPTPQEPWKDWIPGVLGKRQIVALSKGGYIENANGTIDQSSLDLTLTSEAYELLEGSVKPFGRPHLHFLTEGNLAKRLEPDQDEVFELTPRKTYLFRLQEKLHQLTGSGIFGQATAKSSAGRLDVLARLVVDGVSGYEGFKAQELAKTSGELFLEVTSMTFSLRVKKGLSLSQLRLFYGDPVTCEMRSQELYRSILHGSERPDPDESLSVDLTNTKIGGLDAVAFCARADGGPPLNIYGEEKLDPTKYWCFRKADDKSRLRIQQGSFYIIRSKERISLPPGIAVYCRATDETIGEMRIHYAGFVHPFFGTNRKDCRKGTPLIFEVRGHDLDVNLIDGEKMARLIFYRMSQDAVIEEDKKSPEKSAGKNADPVTVKAKPVPDKGYTNQELTLSKFFAEWPSRLRDAGKGVVEPEPESRSAD